jgi:hypothetical protein
MGYHVAVLAEVAPQMLPQFVGFNGCVAIVTPSGFLHRQVTWSNFIHQVKRATGGRHLRQRLVKRCVLHIDYGGSLERSSHQELAAKYLSQKVRMKKNPFVFFVIFVVRSFSFKPT